MLAHLQGTMINRVSLLVLQREELPSADVLQISSKPRPQVVFRSQAGFATCNERIEDKPQFNKQIKPANKA